MFSRLFEFSIVGKVGMICRCENIGAWMTRIGLPGSVRWPRSDAFSVIPRLASCACCAGEKTACGACGRDHWIFYDHKTRRVRDPSCGDTRVFLGVEVVFDRLSTLSLVRPAKFLRPSSVTLVLFRLRLWRFFQVLEVSQPVVGDARVLQVELTDLGQSFENLQVFVLYLRIAEMDSQVLPFAGLLNLNPAVELLDGNEQVLGRRVGGEASDETARIKDGTIK
jgi:hypothetical protein